MKLKEKKVRKKEIKTRSFFLRITKKMDFSSFFGFFFLFSLCLFFHTQKKKDSKSNRNYFPKIPSLSLFCFFLQIHFGLVPISRQIEKQKNWKNNSTRKKNVIFFVLLPFVKTSKRKKGEKFSSKETKKK